MIMCDIPGFHGSCGTCFPGESPARPTTRSLDHPIDGEIVMIIGASIPKIVPSKPRFSQKET